MTSARLNPPIHPPYRSPEEYLDSLIASKLPEMYWESEMLGWAGTCWMITMMWISENTAKNSPEKEALLVEAREAHNKFFGKYSALIPRAEDYFDHLADMPPVK